MQSIDYVPGVSGWKIDKNLMELNGGPWGPIRIGELDASPTRETQAVEAPAEPFVVVDRESITADKIASNWAVKVELRNGRYVATGIELGVEQEAAAPSSIADQVRDAIRAEIRPGGLLHRN